MKEIEALYEAFKNGKKIRQKYWPAAQFIEIKNGKFIVGNDNLNDSKEIEWMIDEFYNNLIEEEDMDYHWEIYKEQEEEKHG